MRVLQARYELFFWDQVRRYTLVQDAIRDYPRSWRWVKKKWTGITPKGRKRMSTANKGKKNPNYGGLSPEHKAKLSLAAKRRDRRQIRNPYYGRKHTVEARLKMSLAAKKRRFRWAMEPGGRPHRVPRNFELPLGWRWGMGRWRVH
jgi:hypothetical protein